MNKKKNRISENFTKSEELIHSASEKLAIPFDSSLRKTDLKVLKHFYMHPWFTFDLDVRSKGSRDANYDEIMDFLLGAHWDDAFSSSS